MHAVFPSPVVPIGHLHVCDPTTLMQIAEEWHVLSKLFLHSLMSSQIFGSLGFTLKPGRQ